ncbi:hypothetical protein EE612_002351 [Oryza sativa]|nr:hypothetical protein EE612_002351 [Oryza sativa]
MDCSRSAVRTNNSGESGSPCLTPLLHLKVFPGTPFSITEVETDFKTLLTKLIQDWLNPLACKICRIASCSTRWKAFSKSIFMIIISLLICWHW